MEISMCLRITGTQWDPHMRGTTLDWVGSGWRGVWLTGVVQEEHQSDSPGQHGVPSPHQHPRVEQRPESHGLGPRPSPPGRSARKVGPLSSGAAETRGLVALH